MKNLATLLTLALGLLPGFRLEAGDLFPCRFTTPRPLPVRESSALGTVEVDRNISTEAIVAITLQLPSAQKRSTCLTLPKALPRVRRSARFLTPLEIVQYQLEQQLAQNAESDDDIHSFSLGFSCDERRPSSNMLVATSRDALVGQIFTVAMQTGLTTEAPSFQCGSHVSFTNAEIMMLARLKQ